MRRKQRHSKSVPVFFWSVLGESMYIYKVVSCGLERTGLFMKAIYNIILSIIQQEKNRN